MTVAPAADAVRLSVLDLGSNSFHVLVADAFPDGAIVPVAREREMLHLGAMVEEHGLIPDRERVQAVEVVAHLTELARRLGSQRRLAVATSALRDAANGARVLGDMEEAADTSVRTLDGLEEARLAYRGVRASVALHAEPVLVLDLGGGSLELAVGRGSEVIWATSLPLGVSRLSTGLSADPPPAAEVAALRKHVKRAVRPVRDEIAHLAPAATVAVGGTIRAMSRIIAEDRHEWLPSTLNQITMSRADIRGLRDELVAMTLAERESIAGMKFKRADRLHVAAVIFAAVLSALGLDEFMLSDWGLREGVLLDHLGIDDVPSPAQLRQREVTRVRRTFAPEDPHLPHVALLAEQLFDGTRSLHGLDDHARELLVHGARLHDIGETLALRGHHHHGAYLLEHAEMRGFAPAEIAVLCSLIRFHKSRGVGAYPPLAALSAANRALVAPLLALLQLADGLDRARDQAVTGLTVDTSGEEVVVTLAGTGLHVARAEFERKTALFEREFGRCVRVTE